MRLSLSPVGGYWLVALVAMALVALVVLVGPRVKSTGRRRILSGLRWGVIILAILAMLRPTVVHSTTRRQSATLLVLMDQSRSMGVGDGFNSQTRWQTLRGAMDESDEILHTIAEELKVKLYLFDSAPRAIELGPKKLELPADTPGAQTAIGAVLEDVLRRESGQRLAGVILLSDGAQRAYAPLDAAPQTAARRLADLGYPLHTVAFGQSRASGETRDVALSDLDVTPTVFVKNQLTALCNVTLTGLANQEVPVELWFEVAPGKMERVASTRIRGQETDAPQQVMLNYVPQTPGEFKVTVKVPPQPGELVTTNNELSTFVTVTKGGLNALYVEGALRPEQKFLRWSLDASEDIKVDYLRLDDRHPETRPADLAKYFAPGRYDVYLIGDVDASAFPPADLEALASDVRNGAGLIMLGGLQSFGGGGWYATPLADLIPIVMGPIDRQPLDEPVRSDLHLAGQPRMVPTDLGQRHFVMLLSDPSRNRLAWESLPPLENGANKFRELQPRAQVLAQSAEGEPLLVARDIGQGRVLAFAGDSTWRWWLAGHQDEHRRFWRQVVLWLSHKEDAQDAGAWIRLIQRRYAPGQRVEFAAGYKAPDGAAGEAQLDVQVVGPDGSMAPARLSREGAAWQGVFDEARAAGDYTIVATARDSAGQELGVARARFLVFQQDLELDNPAADPQMLASLSAMTGGESVPPEQLSSLLERLANKPLNLDVLTEEKIELWDNWAFLLLLASLLGLEWFLRKRWGLV